MLYQPLVWLLVSAKEVGTPCDAPEPAPKEEVSWILWGSYSFWSESDPKKFILSD